MSEGRTLDPRTNVRPQSKAFLRVGVDNAYERLGVSPLASTEEIASRISDLRAKAIKKGRALGTRSDEIEHEVHRLDKIDEEIGDQRRRDRYDEKHPQNIVLTVQASRSEEAWAKHRKAGLISEWLLEQLGDDALLPTPRCLRLWAPAGIDDTVLAFLQRFARESPVADAGASRAADERLDTPISVADLDNLIKEM